MTRRLTVLFASFEALLVVGIGIAIPLVPLTLMWAFQYGFGPDWLIFWRAAVDTWLIGHGVDVILRLDPVLVEQLGVAGAEAPIHLTIAALGFAVVTLLLGVRAGGRVADTGHRLLGEVTAFATFGLLSLGLTLTALDDAARPSIVQGALLPTLVFALGLLIGVLREGAEIGPDAPGSSVRDWIADWSPRVRALVGTAFRAGTASAAFVMLAASVAVAAMLFVNYAELIRLYEGLHAGPIGGLALTAAQLAFVPNLVIWGASWLVGPGFALGTGSTVAPLGTALGPIPAVPVFGALPPDDLAYGFVGILVPVIAAFFAGVALRRRLAPELGDGGRFGRIPWFAGLVVGGAVVGGVLLGALAWASAGAAGPGRLVDVGPDPVVVGGFAALEFAIGLALGVAAGGVGRDTLRRFVGHDDEETPVGAGSRDLADLDRRDDTPARATDDANADADSSTSVSAPRPGHDAPVGDR